MARALRLAGLTVGGLLAFVVVVSAQGWLYVLRGSTLIGPQVHDALPLDELPRHDSVSLLLFMGVWACAGILVGLIAKKARVDRLTAALFAALATGLWLFVTTWVSLVVVRQVANRQAFHAAIHVPALYLAAGLIGLGCAVLGRSDARPSQRGASRSCRPRRRRRNPRHRVCPDAGALQSCAADRGGRSECRPRPG